MDVQTIFYSVGTIFMLLGILIMVAVIYFLWKVERGIIDFRESVNHKLRFFFPEIFGFLIKSFKEFFKKNDK